ncbi:MAG: Rieske (2Fe-2S) protein [Candidatus Bathyarchaeota archaeon]|nr:Rieske (2Fe-2S) protein [Candidatus Bathyarchaeota archaeon]
MSEDSFILVSNENELKNGSMKLFNVAGKNILLARFNDQIYGISNRCPHMGCSLANGKLNAYIVTCPCHGWSFDVRTGQNQRSKDINIQVYQCKLQDGKIYVNIPDVI